MISEHKPKIGAARLLNIKVIIDDKDVIYEGSVDNAKDEIKNLVYKEMNFENGMAVYKVDSSLEENKKLLK